MEAIARLVPQGSRVLDLGCGDGALLVVPAARARLHRLRRGDRRRQRAGLRAARGQRDPAQPGRRPGHVWRQQFDVVLQIDTLQHLRNAEVMLRETARVGRTGMVAFPNFAHWPNRLSHAARAHARHRRLPYQWYDTPNIRVGTYKDFEVLAHKNRLRILDSFGLQDGREVRWLPNARAGTAVFHAWTIPPTSPAGAPWCCPPNPTCRPACECPPHPHDRPPRRSAALLAQAGLHQLRRPGRADRLHAHRAGGSAGAGSARSASCTR
jgi:SAM-dependent methyltransferase